MQRSSLAADHLKSALHTFRNAGKMTMGKIAAMVREACLLVGDGSYRAASTAVHGQAAKRLDSVIFVAGACRSAELH